MPDKILEFIIPLPLPPRLKLVIVFAVVTIFIWASWATLLPRLRKEIACWMFFNPWFYISIVVVASLSITIPLQKKVPPIIRDDIIPPPVPMVISPVNKDSQGVTEPPQISQAEKLINDMGKDSYDRYKAIEALVELGDNSIPFLITALKNSNWAVRDGATYVLGRINNRKSVEPIISVLQNDANPNVRWRSAYTLGEIKDQRAVSPLIAALRNDGNQGVREEAARALGKIKDIAAVGPLISSLKNDGNQGVREEAAWALGEIKDIAVVGPLISSLKVDSNQDVRLAVITALSKISLQIQDPKIITVLNDALQDSNIQIRNKAGEALKELGKLGVRPGNWN